MLALALAYYAAAKVGQTLRYTASVAAMWPPAGVGIAALYLAGLRWWPGVLLGELVINTELHFSDPAIPLVSLFGQQTGNMAEIVIGAVLLTRLIGRRAGLERVDQVVGMLAALAVAAAISASVGTVSMLAGGVVEASDAPTFWRTWLARRSRGRPRGRLHRTGVEPGAGRGVAPAAHAGGRADARRGRPAQRARVLHRGTDHLHGVPGADLVGVPLRRTGRDAGHHDRQRAGDRDHGQPRSGPFFQQPIDHRTLGTQLYIAVTAITTLILSAVICERERSATALTEAKLREGERAIEERQRIARDLHDSVSQALFSTLLHTRLAQRALGESGTSRSVTPARALRTIAELTRGAQTEMRALISELGREPLAGGLVPALARHVAKVVEQDGVDVRFEAPDDVSRCRRAPRRICSASAARHWRIPSSIPGRPRHGCGCRPCRRACCSKSATTAAASTRGRTTPGTSASSRCAAGPPRSAGG